MNAPFDPNETHDGSEDDPFGENSRTWGAADPHFDELLRERIGPLEPLPTPPYAFERVLLTGRRRRTRKVWSIGAAAAFVVMAGTAGTTVALHGASPGGTLPPAATGPASSVHSALLTASAGPTPTPSASSAGPTPSTTVSSSTAAAASPSQSSVPQCHSDDMQLTASLQPGGNDIDAILIVLRNNSGHACTVYGFPGLETETVGQQLQNTKVIRQSASTAATVTLGQGDSVSTIAEFNPPSATATASPQAGCGAPAYYLAVIPPDEQSQLVEPIQGGPVTVCSNGDMDVVPFTSGSAG